jgi:hypothetical protein
LQRPQRNKPSIPLRWVLEQLGDGHCRTHAKLGEVLRTMANMDWDDYLRHEAVIYRHLAEKTEDVFGKQELFELAAICEEVANSIEDRLTGG